MMADPVDPRQTDATWQQLFRPQRGGELATPDDRDNPSKPVQPRRQRLDRAVVDTIAQRRREAIRAAQQRQGTSAHELLARCRQLNAEHRCPGRCVFTGQLRRVGLP
jgi:hypothetical protein